MASGTRENVARRSLGITILLAAVGGLAIFTLLWLVSGGLMLAVIAAAAFIAVLAVLHFLVWGHSMSSQVRAVYSRARVEQPAAQFPDTFTLPLDDRERAHLLGLLDWALAERATEQAPALPAAVTVPEERAVLQGVRDRLQRYGA
jgi:hypothetical protein